VNPSHLFLGARKENMADAMRKDRTSRGERNTQSKLTDKKITRAKALRAKGWTYRRIADRFNVANPTLWKALSGETWKHLEVRNG
jgi:hypothetical protein